jgi:hypothetical protein
MISSLALGRGSVAETLVFVDDAMLGRFPSICVIDGVPTVDRLAVTRPVGGDTGLGIAWVLLLLGPLGWIGLLIFAAVGRGREQLTIEVPFSEDAYRRMQSARRWRNVAVVVLCVTVVAALVSNARGGFDGKVLAAALAVVAVTLLVEAVVNTVRYRRTTVTFELDGSRRWLHLYGVHPWFVDAVEGVRSVSSDRSSAPSGGRVPSAGRRSA